MTMITPGIYTSGPKDTLVTKDVYREDVLAAANTYKENPAELDSATSYLTDANVSPKTITDALKDAIKSTSTGNKLDMSVLKRRLEKSLNIPGNINDLSNSTKNELFKGLEDMTGLKGLKVAYNGVESAIKGYDSLNASGIVGVLNALAGESGVLSLFDLDAEAAGLRYFLGLATDWGLVDLVDDIIKKMKDSDDLNEMLEELAIRAAKNGNFSSCKSLCEKMGHGRTYAIMDDIIGSFMASYQIGANETRAYNTIGNEFLAFFNWISPAWDHDPVEADLVSLRYYIKATAGMREVLSHTAKYLPAGAADSVRQQQYTAVVKESFPDLVDL